MSINWLAVQLAHVFHISQQDNELGSDIELVNWIALGSPPFFVTFIKSAPRIVATGLRTQLAKLRTHPPVFLEILQIKIGDMSHVER